MSTRILVLSAAALIALGVNAAEPVTSPAKVGPQAQTIEQARSRINNDVSAMDLNRDGFIDANELSARRDQRKAERQRRRAERAQQRFAAFDTDGDGKVSVVEVTAARTARLQAMDADGDGTITPQEFRQGRRGMRGKHHRAGMPVGASMHEERIH
ncbi:MAG TPA: EF-hand domain-containing protein [Chiayiivirga sp.]|nr:EF-hand domain-containing protein [Chiayiivirga sp.]